MIFVISDEGGLAPTKEERAKSDQKFRCEAIRVQLPLPLGDKKIRPTAMGRSLYSVVPPKFSKRLSKQERLPSMPVCNVTLTSAPTARRIQRCRSERNFTLTHSQKSISL